ncbi:MAG: lipid A export permease/ATP-binding protein MsbA [Pseudomonadota bacterium]
MTVTLPAAADARAVYGRLLRYARPWRGQFMIGVAGMALYASTDAGIAWFVKQFLKHAFVQPDPRVAWAVPLGAVLLFSLRGLGDYLATWFPARVGRQVVKSLRRDLFAQYLHLPAAAHDREPAGRMLSRLVFDAEQMAEAATNSIGIVVRDSLALLGLLAYMLYLSWQFTLLVLVAAPAIGWILGRINQRFRRHSGRIQQSMGQFTRVAKESLDAQRLIKISTAEVSQQLRFEQVNEQNRRSNERLLNVRAASGPVVQLVAALALAAVLALAINKVMAAEVAVDEFMAYLTALLLLLTPLKRLVNVGGPLQQGISAGAGIFSVLDQPREPQGGGRPLQRARGEVEFRNAGFGYGADPVLDQIAFTAVPGQTIAIVGKSGAGKSTLVSLLPRLYDVTAGAVLLDGVDVRDYDLRDLRRQIAYVSQDLVLFDDTIRNNIAFGMEDAPATAVEAAARAAYVLEFAAALPQGLDTPVGDRGGLLSGGQRQRIAIARAILRNAPVLVLDEATSALDSESERHVQDALAELMRGSTTLVIAHRLATVEQADCIIVMNEGRIAEAGTHAELLAKGALYSQLHRLQFNA